MDEKRDRSKTPSGEPSPYVDALYSQAPEVKRSSYGYNLAQCYARASSGPEEAASAKKKNRSGFGFYIVTAVMVLCLLGAGLLGSGGMFFADRASAASSDVSAREIYEDYTAAVEAEEREDELALTTAAEKTAAELPPEEIYEIACACTVGVKVPGYAQNIFGQVNATTVNGTGIVLTADGYILTNYHIIEAAYNKGAKVVVFTFDSTEHEAEVVGVEMDSDLAVLKIDADEADGLVPAQMGDSSGLRVGEPIYAVGNPLGELTYTMTSGIISALDRNITTDEYVTVNMFQIDAAINSGNSGGPVFNTSGQVIGVVTAKYTQDGMEGLGFAIPISDACEIARDLVEKGYVTGKAYLGLTMANVSSSVAKYYDMVEGVYVYGVEADSCGEAAGIEVGDIITAIDGESVRNSKELAQVVKNYHAGDSAELTVYREQSYITVTVVFDEELPAEQAAETDTETAGRSAEDILRSALADSVVREG